MKQKNMYGFRRLHMNHAKKMVLFICECNWLVGKCICIIAVSIYGGHFSVFCLFNFIRCCQDCQGTLFGFPQHFPLCNLHLKWEKLFVQVHFPTNKKFNVKLWAKRFSVKMHLRAFLGCNLIKCLTTINVDGINATTRKGRGVECS